MDDHRLDHEALSATLTNLGNVQLAWDGSIAASQYFTIWRKLFGEADWSQIGSCRAKKFLDVNIPIGTQSASYLTRAHRGSEVSQGCEPVTILLSSQLAA
ncbi:MAG: hypothetical protein WAO58_07980 [Fimbriimonadaceae bacterium]